MSKEDHYLKGMDLFADDRMDEAVSAFDRALEEDANYGDALHAAAMCCYHNKDLDRALNYGLRYRDVEPDNPLAYTSLSMFYHAKGWDPGGGGHGGQGPGRRPQAVPVLTLLLH